MVHRDVYTVQDSRCYGIQTRSVQWEGGFRQSLMPSGAYDPTEQNTDDCPFEDRLKQYDAATLPIFSDSLMDDGRYCMDGTGLTPLLPAVCDLGTQMRSCGVHRNLVVFGYAAYTRTAETTTATTCVLKATNEVGEPAAGTDGTMRCADGGAGSFSDECYFGTHVGLCGHRRFAFLPADAGPDDPDNSCATANNGYCEDGLMWSIYAPGKNICAPNTDMADCGWRMPKRMARIGVGRENECLVECAEDLIAGTGSAACPAGCSDLTDYVQPALTTDQTDHLTGSSSFAAAWCGRGTQTDQCEGVAAVATDGYTTGSFDYNNGRYRERVLYVQAATIGQQNCTARDNLVDPVNDGPDKVCSDGGVGSKRVLLKVWHPNGTNSHVQGLHEHADFICPYGSQPGVCPNRTLTTFQTNQDELEQPSGPEFSSCFDVGVPDYECCRAEHTFRITGKSDTTQGVANQAEYSDTFCAYPCTDPDDANSVLPCNESASCPPHWTSYYHTSTGCEAYCNAAFQRDGNDGTCIPAVPECANYLDADRFPKEYLDVSTFCICGAKLPSLVDAGAYVDKGTILSSAGRRRLQYQWDDPITPSIDQFHGAHFDLDDQCYASIMDFRTRLLPNTSACSGYMDLLAPPFSFYDPSTNASSFACDQVSTDACCVTERGVLPMSKVWLQTFSLSERSVSEAFGAVRTVGTAIHQSEVAAVGNFDDDEYPDIVIGNRLFLGDPEGRRRRLNVGGAQFQWQAGIPIGARDFVQVYAGEINGQAPDDLVVVYADGAVEVFLTIHDDNNDLPTASGGIGFHSAGVVLPAGAATVTTVAFLRTLRGFGTNCRGGDLAAARPPRSERSSSARATPRITSS